MYDIRLKQIECFLNLAQSLNFTSTAASLNISQPLVSKWIKSLEEELHTPLFIRNKDSVSLTESGHFLYNKWSLPFSDMVDAAYGLQNGISENEKLIRIGILDRCETDIDIHNLIRDFLSSHPDYNIRVSSGGIRETIDRLMGHYLDIAFHTTLDSGTQKDINFLPIKKVDFYIAISSRHPAAKSDRLSLYDLKDETFFAVSADESPTGGRRIIAQCQKEGFTPNMQYVSNLPSLALAVVYQCGITITTKAAVSGYEDMIKLYQLQNPPPTESLAVLWRKEDPGKEALEFAEYVKCRP